MNCSKDNRGYSLIELIVAIAIFSVAAGIIVEIIVGMMAARRKIANIQSVHDNIRFSIELMTKEMRVGRDFILRNDGVTSCGLQTNASEIQFQTFNPISGAFESRIYYLNSGTGKIMRVRNVLLCASAAPFTSDDVIVDYLNFLLIGDLTGPTDGQPRLTLSVRFRSGDPAVELRSQTNLQTTVTQRLRDF